MFDDWFDNLSRSFNTTVNYLEDGQVSDAHYWTHFLIDLNADQILFTGEEPDLYNLFEDAVKESRLRHPGIFIDERYEEHTATSDYVNLDEVELIDERRPSSQVVEVLNQSEKGDRTLVFTDKAYRDELREWVPESEENVKIVYK